MSQLKNPSSNEAYKHSVVITGGAKRLGEAMVRQFFNAGYRVHLHYFQSSTDAENLAHELNTIQADSVKTHRADLSDINQVAQWVDTLLKQDNRIQVLINNASLYLPTSVDDVNMSDWQSIVSTNLQAPLWISTRLAFTLAENSGAIINMGDIYGLRAQANHSIYNLTKSGIHSLTQSLAVDLAPNVRVNAIAPGAIIWPESMSEKEAKTRLSRIPLNRCGEPTDIAEAAWFLSQAKYITGQILAVDGGRTLNI